MQTNASALINNLLQLDSCSKYDWYQPIKSLFREKIERVVSRRYSGVDPETQRSVDIFKTCEQYLNCIEQRQIEESRKRHVDDMLTDVRADTAREVNEIGDIVLRYDILEMRKIAPTQYEFSNVCGDYANSACTFIATGFIVDMCNVFALISSAAVQKDVYPFNYKVHARMMNLIAKEYWQDSVINSINHYKQWERTITADRPEYKDKYCDPHDAVAFVNGKPPTNKPSGMKVTLSEALTSSGLPATELLTVSNGEFENVLSELRTLSIVETTLHGKMTVTAFLFVAGCVTMVAIYMPYQDEKVWWIFDSHGRLFPDWSAAIAFDNMKNAASFVTDKIKSNISENARTAGVILKWSYDMDSFSVESALRHFNGHLSNKLKSFLVHKT